MGNWSASSTPEADKPYAEITVLHAKDDASKIQEVAVEIAQDAKVEEAPREQPGVWMLIYCCLGIMISISLNALVLENMTTHRMLGEMSLTFAFCLCYSGAALLLRCINKEKRSTMPQSSLMIVGALAFGSTISSIIALRYVTFIVRILGKSCKSIPVMVIGFAFGKRYALRKYVSVLVLSMGVAVFLVGSTHNKHKHNAPQNGTSTSGPEEAVHVDQASNVLFGSALLVLSLLFDGATGALEDRLLEKYHIGAFDLMFTVNIWKSVFALVGMIIVGELPTFVETALPSLPSLVLLGATGAFGQAFVFFTLSKFGALTTAIIGTCRKVISIVLSVIFFGHILSSEQFVGLVVAFAGIALNWVRIQSCRRKSSKTEMVEVIKAAEVDELLEVSDATMSSEEDEDLSDFMPDTPSNEQVQRGLELVKTWRSETGDPIHEESKEEEDYTVRVSL